MEGGVRIEAGFDIFWMCMATVLAVDREAAIKIFATILRMCYVNLGMGNPTFFNNISNLSRSTSSISSPQFSLSKHSGEK